MRVKVRVKVRVPGEGRGRVWGQGEVSISRWQLAHALDDRLARVLVAAEPEGRVLGGELDERHGHLLLVRLGLGLDAHLDHLVRARMEVRMRSGVRVGSGLDLG